MPADYHTHTPLCRHATGEPEEYLRAAVVAGLHEYGISDHAPMTPEPFDDWRMTQAELPAYLDWIERARAATPPSLTVRAGLECDWIAGIEPWTEQLREMHDWDYLIGSVHYIGDKWDFDNPKWIGRWGETDVDEAWTQYFKAYEAMIRSGLFDIYGHADLIKKFCFKPQGDLVRYYEPIVAAMAEMGGIMEINTAGWHKPCEEAYPSLQLLEMSNKAGVPIIISSDAHSPEEVARDFARAATLARTAGYTETTILNGTTEPLPQ